MLFFHGPCHKIEPHAILKTKKFSIGQEGEKMPITWNPWHGCHKISAGCQNCYVYRIDEKHGRDASQVTRNKNFSIPIRRNRSGGYKVPPGEIIYTCFSSDFLLEDADPWREEAWDIMRARPDCQFLFITKRIHRLAEVLPADWGDGYENVHICCTVENQDRADYRLPIFRDAPIRRKSIVCEPLLSQINLSPYLGSWVQEVLVGGESGNEARVCDYNWILDIREQCIFHQVPFTFRQTGARLYKDNHLYRIKREFQHSQARKANINFFPNR